MLCMEMELLEAAKPQPPSNEVIASIRAGKLSTLNNLLAKQPTRSAPVSGDPSNLEASAQNIPANVLGFTNLQLTAEEQHLAQNLFDNFWPRYKSALLPLVVAAIATGNLVVTAISVDKQLNTPGNTQSLQSIVLGSDGLTLGQTVITLAAAGGIMGKQIYAGVLDLVQKDKVDNLKNAQALLKILQAQAANNTGATVTATQAALANQVVVVAADTNSANAATTAEQQAAAAATTGQQQFDATNTTAIALNNGGLQEVGQQVAQVVEQVTNAAGNQTVVSTAPTQPAAPVTRNLLTRARRQHTTTYKPATDEPTIAHQFDASTIPLITGVGAPQEQAVKEKVATAAQPAGIAQRSLADATAPEPERQPVVSLQDVIADETASAALTGIASTEAPVQEKTAPAIQGVPGALEDTTQVAAQLVQAAAQELAEEEERQVLAAQAVLAPQQQIQEAPPFGILPATMAWLQEEAARAAQAKLARQPSDAASVEALVTQNRKLVDELFPVQDDTAAAVQQADEQAVQATAATQESGNPAAQEVATPVIQQEVVTPAAQEVAAPTPQRVDGQIVQETTAAPEAVTPGAQEVAVPAAQEAEQVEQAGAPADNADNAQTDGASESLPL